MYQLLNSQVVRGIRVVPADTTGEVGSGQSVTAAGPCTASRRARLDSGLHYVERSTVFRPPFPGRFPIPYGSFPIPFPMGVPLPHGEALPLPHRLPLSPPPSLTLAPGTPDPILI